MKLAGALWRRQGLAPWRKARGIPWILPAVALTATFVAYPAIDAFRVSTLEWPGYGPGRFTGLSNYSSLLTDPVALRAARNSVVFALLTASATVAVGGAIAVALERGVPVASLFQAAVVFPIILPGSAVALMWAAGLDPYYGWVDGVLQRVHLGPGRAWLSDPSTAVLVVAVVNVVQYTGFPMLIVYSALRGIPRDIHEAATMDAVSELQRARYVSLPLTAPVIAAVWVLQILFGLVAFDYMYVMTNGGPGTASEVLGTFVYHQAYIYHRFGYAAAAGATTTVASALIAIGYAATVRLSTVRNG